MGRPAFGADRILKELVIMAGNKETVDRPVDALSIQTGLSRVTIQKYLSELSAGGYVDLIYGDRGSIKRLTLKKREMAFSLASPKKNPEPEKKPPPPVTPAPIPPAPRSSAPVPMTQPAESLIAALVDYDNVIGHVREAGFAISFAKLRDLLRSYGRVIFADAYLSPVSNNQINVARLCKAVFRPIACQQAYKDKDSVDENMKRDARQLLQWTAINKILIISRDQDFRDLEGFAADLHKQAVFIDVLKERVKIEGYDEMPQLVRSRALERFSKALEMLQSGWNGLTNEEEKCVRLVKEIILAVDQKEKSTSQLTPFKPLMQILWRDNRQWHNLWTEMDLQKAMSALIDDNVLKRDTGVSSNRQPFQYYTLNLKHPTTIKVLQNPKNL